MSSTMQPHRQEPQVHVAAGTRGPGFKAWVSVALIPVLLVVSVVATTLVYQWFGYLPGDSGVSIGVDVAVGMAAIAIFLSPCVAAVVYGARSGRAGDWKGWVALAIGALAGVGLATLTFFGTFGPF